MENDGIKDQSTNREPDLLQWHRSGEDLYFILNDIGRF